MVIGILVELKVDFIWSVCLSFTTTCVELFKGTVQCKDELK